MKKLALALVVSAVAGHAASANIGTGFYVGAAAGYGSTTGKFTAANPGGVVVSGSTDVGANFGNIGVHAGYGYVTGCFYLGGEVAYTFEGNKTNNTLGGPGAVTLKRDGYFNAALRAGYVFTANTLGYVRLGGNIGRWKLNDNFTQNPNVLTGSRTRLSFTPGFGLETAVHRNVYLRAEYTYEFGPSVRATRNLAPTVGAFSNVGSLRSQSAKVGLSYKF